MKYFAWKSDWCDRIEFEGFLEEAADGGEVHACRVFTMKHFQEA